MTLKTYLSGSLVWDIKAGFITSVVALPLAIAFAIASGLPAVVGLYTAIIGGILGSLLGGSQFSITGPTGAMVVLILVIMQKYGLEGLIFAGLIMGIMQILFGFIGVGKVVSYIPLPVVSGFTAGIGILIFLGQVPNALGISVGYHEHIWDTFIDILHSISGFQIAAVIIMLVSVASMFFLPKLFSKISFLKNVPPSVVPLIASVVAVVSLSLTIPLVGKIPTGLPHLTLPVISFEGFKNILPHAFNLSLLGAIEALLCAVVCDGMTRTKHDPNRELIGQGITNIILPFFGGMPATAAIARSAVNIREGAKTRMAGVYHAIFLLIYMIFLGPVVAVVPKAFLAGVLFYVSIRMINYHEFKTIMHISRLETIVLFTTLMLTVFTDLVFAVQVGMILALLLLFIRLTQHVTMGPTSEYDDWINDALSKNKVLRTRVSVYTINGPFFFGALSIFEEKIKEELNVQRPVIILLMNHVSFIDSSGIARLKDFILDRLKAKGVVFCVGLNSQVRDRIYRDVEFTAVLPRDHTFTTFKAALETAEKIAHNL